MDMSDRRYDLEDALSAIDPGALHYDDWLAVGQALHHEGFDSRVWRDWTARDARPDHKHRLEKLEYKWGGFGENAGNPVTGGTIVKIARDCGWHAERAQAAYDVLDWNVQFYGDEDEPAIVDAASVSEHDEQVKPLYGDGCGLEELTAYIGALFDDLARLADENDLPLQAIRAAMK